MFLYVQIFRLKAFYFLEFLCRWNLARLKRSLRFRARRDSLGYMLKKASRASSTLGGFSGMYVNSSESSFSLGFALKEIDLREALHAKYTSRPPGITTAARNTSACTNGFAIFRAHMPYLLAFAIRFVRCVPNVSHREPIAPSAANPHSKPKLDMPISISMSPHDVISTVSYLVSGSEIAALGRADPRPYALCLVLTSCPVVSSSAAAT